MLRVSLVAALLMIAAAPSGAQNLNIPVRSSSWRTWSSKRILKEWQGIWRVDILLPGGKLLISKEFLVKPTG
jgi:hypothetical protein